MTQSPRMSHYKFDLARLRTPVYCEPGFNDGITRIARSPLPDAGYGLFAEVAINAKTPLYEYTGKQVTEEHADRYPNAYMFSSHLYGVLDASQEVCSPAKFVNTKGPVLGGGNNCEFLTHEGRVFLITSRAIAKGEELCSPYGRQNPKWPMTFVGCAVKEKIAFAR